jgi:acetyltransferase-like isoleucine patch superfamily enzyme
VNRRTITLLYTILSLISQLILAVLLGLAAVPVVVLVRWTAAVLLATAPTIWQVLLFSLSIGLAYLVFGNTLLLLTVAIRFLFRIRSYEQRGSLFSFSALNPTLYNFLLSIAAFFYLPLLRSSILIVWFYRGMGAKIGRGTVIATTRLWDCDLIEIGEDCMIGGNASIAAHTINGSRARLRRVRIGNKVTIGANSSIMPGVVIEDDVVVGANSLVLQGTRLVKSGVYLGVPVKKMN